MKPLLLPIPHTSWSATDSWSCSTNTHLGYYIFAVFNISMMPCLLHPCHVWYKCTLTATSIIVQYILVMFNEWSSPRMQHPQLCPSHPCHGMLHLHLFQHILTMFNMSLPYLLDISFPFNMSSPCSMYLSHHVHIILALSAITCCWLFKPDLAQVDWRSTPGAHEREVQPHNLLVILCSSWAVRLQGSAPEVTGYRVGHVGSGILALSTVFLSYLVLGVNHSTEWCSEMVYQ